jgi:hypothetical protein
MFPGLASNWLSYAVTTQIHTSSGDGDAICISQGSSHCQ